ETSTAIGYGNPNQSNCSTAEVYAFVHYINWLVSGIPDSENTELKRQTSHCLPLALQLR
ncbi:unnamed protein product, partial [Musa acuminata var. zebrina]